MDRKDYWQTGYHLAHLLFRQYELKKKLAGAYFDDGARVEHYRCLTGEAQIAIIWLLIAHHENDERFLNAASKIIDGLCKAQTKTTMLFLKGGLTGSKPFYGRYIALRQPNWAAKFFMDALFLENESYKSLSSSFKSPNP